jgi:hypothetical protein
LIEELTLPPDMRRGICQELSGAGETFDRMPADQTSIDMGSGQFAPVVRGKARTSEPWAVVRMSVITALFLACCTGCRTIETNENRKSRHDGLDGGYVAREACDMPTATCYDRCVKRSASVTCVGCCRDQEFLCDTAQKHSFEICDSAP